MWSRAEDGDVNFLAMIKRLNKGVINIDDQVSIEYVNKFIIV